MPQPPSPRETKPRFSDKSLNTASLSDGARDQLATVLEQHRPPELANEDVVPLSSALQATFGLEGLRRGSTVLIQGEKGTGATSLALALLARATSEGLWCSVVGPLDLGIVAGVELGVDLEHFVVVDTPRARVATVLGALVDGCDVVTLRLPLSLTRQEMIRLSARARQRRVLLLLVRDLRSHANAWAEAPEVTAVVHTSEFVGITDGGGRIAARRIVVETLHRRGGAVARPVTLWLPSFGGDLCVGDDQADRTSRVPIADIDAKERIAEQHLRALAQ